MKFPEVSRSTFSSESLSGWTDHPQLLRMNQSSLGITNSTDVTYKNNVDGTKNYLLKISRYTPRVCKTYCE
jgi:hypothetical protein